mgnify:CR=1
MKKVLSLSTWNHSGTKRKYYWANLRYGFSVKIARNVYQKIKELIGKYDVYIHVPYRDKTQSRTLMEHELKMQLKERITTYDY